MSDFRTVPLSQLVEGLAGMVLPFGVDVEQPEGDPGIGSVLLHEPGNGLDYSGAVVLVSGRVPDRFALGAVLDETAAAAAVVLPHDASADASCVARGVSHRGPRLLRRSQWTGWSELFQALLRLVSAGGADPAIEQLDDLQGLARWISEQSGSAVTIEDLDSRVLAYAVVGEEVDPIRNQTILSGEVPAWRVERLMSSGMLPAVWRSDDVVVRDAEGDDPARMVISLKAGSETLGTIWAALEGRTDRGALRELLLGVRESASAMLLRDMHRERHERRVRESALAELLASGIDSGVPASLLGLGRDAVHAVVALDPGAQRARDLMFHLQALRAGSVAASAGSELFVVMPLRGTERTAAEAAASLEEDLRRVSGGASDAVLAVGVPVSDLAGLRASAVSAGRVLRAAGLSGVRSRRAERGPTVLTEDDASEALVMMRVVELLEPAEQEIAEPLEALEEYDRAHGTRFVETAAAVIEHPGNLADAARTLDIHANSLRYRVERIEAIAGIDLRSAVPRTRLALGLLLRGGGGGTA